VSDDAIRSVGKPRVGEKITQDRAMHRHFTEVVYTLITKEWDGVNFFFTGDTAFPLVSKSAFEKNKEVK
jgi:hypothetical protein